LTFIREVITLPTPKIDCPGCFIERSDTPSTINAILAQRADKPVTYSAEMTRCCCQPNLVIIFRLFPGIAVGRGVLKPDVVIAVHRKNCNTDTAGFFAEAIFPDNPAGATTAEVIMLSQERDANATAILDGVFLVPVIPAHVFCLSLLFAEIIKDSAHDTTI